MALLAGFASPAVAAVVRVATGPVTADGKTSASVVLWTDTPRERVKISPGSGALGAVEVRADGVIVARWTPDAASTAGSVPWTVTSGKAVFTLEIPVVPPIGTSLSVAVDPPLVKPGGVASLKITGVSGDAAPLIRASSGSLGSPTRETDGWRVQWVAPRVTEPTVVAITAADGAYSDVNWTHGVIRVAARQTLRAEVPVGSNSTLVTGGTRLGPVPCVRGAATFDVEVDPAQPTASLEVVRADATTETRGVILAAGKGALTWVPGPTSYVGPVVAVLRLSAISATGEAATSTPPRVVATAGTVRDLRLEGSLWRVEIGLPLAAGAFEVRAEREGATANLTLRSAPLAPVAWTVGSLPASGGEVALRAVAPTTLEVKEGRGTPRVSGGEGVARLSPASGSVRVSAVAHPVTQPASSAPRRLVAWSNTPVVAADGLAEALLTIAVLDAGNAAVANTAIAVRLLGGDGELASEAITDAHGLAHLVYKAGKTPGPVGIRMESGSVWSEFTLFQAGGASGPDLAVPLDAPASAWRDASAWAVVYREGAAPAPPPTVGLPEIAAVAGEAPPKVRSRSPGGPLLVAALTDAHGTLSQSAAAPGLVKDVEAPSPPIGFLGADVRLEWPFPVEGWAVGPLVRLGVVVEPRQVGPAVSRDAQTDLLAGVRASLPGDRLVPNVSLAVHSLSVGAFALDAGVPSVFSATRLGVRPAVGATLQVASVRLSGEVGVTLAPLPVAERVELAAVFGTSRLAPLVSGALDVRAFEDEGAELRQTRGILALGLRYGGF